ncbi:MAG: isoprenylcysteine carboxylmethyltransferase family protein [Pseudomonadota bacterium]
MAVLAWAIAKFLPGLAFEFPGRIFVSLVWAICGAITCGTGVISFRRVGTTMNPTKPDQASVLITAGIYGISRNPMYLGFLALLIGWSLYLANAVALILVPIGFVAYMNRFQIAAEERALKALFGDEYVSYARRVRRWL